jgi:hypothetical protein
VFRVVACVLIAAMSISATLKLYSTGGTGPFTSFEVSERIDNAPYCYDHPAGIVAYLILRSLSSADRIEMTRLKGNQYSFTIPAHEWEGIDEYSKCKASISSMTFAGTMDANMTTGTFEISASPNVTYVCMNSSCMDTSKVKDVRIAAVMEPYCLGEQNTRLLAFESAHTVVYDMEKQDSRQFLENPFIVMPNKGAEENCVDYQKPILKIIMHCD